MAGAGAGLAVFLVDALLAWLTLGYPLPLRNYFVAWYLGAGAVSGVALGLGGWLLRGRAPSAVALAAACGALLYAPAVAERLHNALAFRLGGALAGLVAVVAVVAYGGGLLGMRRLFGVPGLLTTAGAAALGLALNRNVIPLPAEPRALFADALIVAAAVALAAVFRLSGWQRVAAALGAVASAAILAAMLGTDSDPAIAEDLPSSAPGSPNLILVIVDTLRADVFYAVLEETEEGKELQRALGGAVRFSNAVAAAPWTPPSVGSILTGLYPQEHGLNRGEGASPSRPLNRLDESVTTLAEHLRDRGYRTAAVATNPFLQPEAGVAQGFRDFEILQDGTAKLPLLTAVRASGLAPTELYQDAERVRQRLDRRLAALVHDPSPFFLWLHLMDPHQPLRSHPDLAPDPAAAEIGREMRTYRDETRFAARELTRMIERVQERGLWRDTAFVLVSDHGEMMLSDRRFRGSDSERRYRRHGHGHALYRELVRVPLIIRPPGGLAADREVGALTSHVDLAHTVADLLGVERMALPGERVSLAPWLGVEGPDPEPAVRTHVLVGATQAHTDQRALRTPGFKVIEYLDGDRPPELYDLEHDPRERKNLAPRGRRRLAHLQGVLAESWSQLLPPPETEALEMDPETRQRLEALGYL